MQTLDDLRNGTLAGSTQLRLRGLNGIFPDEIFNLAETLEILDLNGNGLSDLPEEFSQLKNLKILFCSNNPFEVLPDVLAECPALEMIGFKSCALRTVPGQALSSNIRWLILTDNQIEKLPAEMGQLHRLQKCMLAGNKLSKLPESMKDCHSLELLRLSANKLTALPDFLFDLPRLSWLTFAGNPFHKPFEIDAPFPTFQRHQIRTLETLGEGASGVISRAEWTNAAPAELIAQTDIAYKGYKGDVTSDGFVADEMDASLAAGSHPNLISIIARNHPADPPGLLMSLIPPEFKNLGLPPSFESCTRDVFPKDQSLSPIVALKIARAIADVMRHLNAQGIAHNDLYAHNILYTESGETLLTDFGAAANIASLPAQQQDGIEKLEIRAFGYLLEDLIGLVPDADKAAPETALLSEIRASCLHTNPAARPTFAELPQLLGN